MQNSCSVGEEDISSVTVVPQPDAEPERHLASNNIPDPVIDQCVSIAKQHVADNSNIKSMEERDIDTFLDEAYKKKVSDEIRQRNKEKKSLRESATQDLSGVSNETTSSVMKDEKSKSHKKREAENIVQDVFDFIATSEHEKNQPKDALHMTEISATARRPKCSSSLLDLAKLFDKASDAEYRTKKANEEEILCWVNFGKEFMVHFSELVENSNGKIGEKKAKGIIYDEMLEHLVTIREKRSKEMGIQLPKISRSSLTRRTQRSMKLVRIFEKIGIDKIKYLSTYSPNSISELTKD